MLTKNDLKAIGQLIRTVIREEAVTKEEAKAFATHMDLAGFATKKDLAGFATKKDLAGFATKKDLAGFATKKDLIGLARGTEIDNLRFEVLDNMKKWRSEIINHIDPVLKRVTSSDEENAILRARDEGRCDEREKFESRVANLEALHPNNRHPS